MTNDDFPNELVGMSLGNINERFYPLGIVIYCYDQYPTSPEAKAGDGDQLFVMANEI